MKIIIALLFVLSSSLCCFGQLQHELLHQYLPRINYHYNGPIKKIVVYEYNSTKRAKWILENSQKELANVKHIMKFDSLGNLIYCSSQTFYEDSQIGEGQIKARSYYWETIFKYDSSSRLVEVKAIDNLDPTKFWQNASFEYLGNSTIHYSIEWPDTKYEGFRSTENNGQEIFIIRQTENEEIIRKRYEFENDKLVRDEDYVKGEISSFKDYSYFDNGKLRNKVFVKNHSKIFETNYTYLLSDYELVKTQYSTPYTKRTKSKIYRKYDNYKNLLKEIDGTVLKGIWSVTEYEIYYE